jgi:hypothetical protein
MLQVILELKITRLSDVGNGRSKFRKPINSECYASSSEPFGTEYSNGVPFVYFTYFTVERILRNLEH